MDTGDHLIEAIATARYRAVRTGLVELHKVLLDAERRRYTRTHGPVEGTQQILRLVMTDPWFAWLRPIAELIVQADERLSTDVPITPADVRALSEHARGLLQHDLGGPTFRDAYQRTLQDVPDVVVSHAQVIKLLD